jgi:Immunity protein 49
MQLNDLRSLNLETMKGLLCVVAAGHPMVVMGEDMQYLSQAFQARAIYHLLLDFDTSAFTMNLQRSAHARRYFLRKSREQGSNDAIFVALSRTDAIFDCIVGGDWLLAMEIGDLSPQEWTPGGEYHEDYCYHRLLHAYVTAVVRRTDLEAAQEWRHRLETIVADIPDSRLDVARLELCTAFLSGDQDSCWVAFERLVESSGEAAASAPLADPRVFEFPWLGAERYISIELLAWISLARSRGWQPPQREYLRCPSAAWTNGRVQSPPDIFLTMEGQFGL